MKEVSDYHIVILVLFLKNWPEFVRNFILSKIIKNCPIVFSMEFFVRNFIRLKFLFLQ